MSSKINLQTCEYACKSSIFQDNQLIYFKKYTKDMYEHLKESASIFPDKLKRVYYIFSKEGFNENMIEDKNIHLFDLKKMFE